jgi:hypothetical protein
MHARLASARLLRSLVAPLILALPPLLWVADATKRASFETLGRDQGIFQYIAWALEQGQRDYRDVRDVNGPLTHFVHRVFLWLGGADEHRFRTLDLVVTGATFFFVGACLPGVGARRPTSERRRPELVERVAWGLAGWVVLSGQYLLYGYWDLAQRESFFDWFLLPSVALALVAQRSPPQARFRLVALAGALSVVPCFGKPTYALFTLAQAATIALDDDLAGARKKTLGAFAIGGAAGVLSQLALLVATGDALAYARIQLADVPAMYRFIWARAPAEIFSIPWNASQAIFAFVGAAVLVSLVLLREIPPRALAIAVLPVCALVSVVGQAKGFPYHFHPVTAGVHLQWLVFAAWLAERTRVAQRRLALVRLLPIAFGAVVALRVATSMEDSPHIRATWLLWGGRTAEERASREYLARFPETDFFPYELRETADFLREHTQPSDRVQTYGMDPYVLFLARRLSATPYIYAYDLDADAALAGWTAARPDEEQAARIRAIRDAHEADLLARVQTAPPAAFVFFDGAPLMTAGDAWEDFASHCPDAARWVNEHYRHAARFGHNHVWLRSDLATLPRDPLEVEPSPEER